MDSTHMRGPPEALLVSFLPSYGSVAASLPTMRKQHMQEGPACGKWEVLTSRRILLGEARVARGHSCCRREGSRP